VKESKESNVSGGEEDGQKRQTDHRKGKVDSGDFLRKGVTLAERRELFAQ